MSTTTRTTIENTKRFLNLADAEGDRLFQRALATGAEQDIVAVDGYCERRYGYEVAVALRAGVGAFDEAMSSAAMKGLALCACAELLRGHEASALRCADLAEQAKARVDAAYAGDT